jgi:hypothetical protein
LKDRGSWVVNILCLSFRLLFWKASSAVWQIVQTKCNMSMYLKRNHSMLLPGSRWECPCFQPWQRERCCTFRSSLAFMRVMPQLLCLVLLSYAVRYTIEVLGLYPIAHKWWQMMFPESWKCGGRGHEMLPC